jgi:hypothetical protein
MFDTFLYKKLEIEVIHPNSLKKTYSIGDTIPDLKGESNYSVIGRYLNSKEERYAAIIVVHNLYIDCVIGEFKSTDLNHLQDVAGRTLEICLMGFKDYLTPKLEDIIRKLSSKCYELEATIQKQNHLIETLSGF